jgi:hypothetical protein
LSKNNQKGKDSLIKNQINKYKKKEGGDNMMSIFSPPKINLLRQNGLFLLEEVTLLSKNQKFG